MISTSIILTQYRKSVNIAEGPPIMTTKFQSCFLFELDFIITQQKYYEKDHQQISDANILSIISCNNVIKFRFEPFYQKLRTC